MPKPKTERNREIVRRLLSGSTTGEIAREHGFSHTNVKRIFRQERYNAINALLSEGKISEYRVLHIMQITKAREVKDDYLEAFTVAWGLQDND